MNQPEAPAAEDKKAKWRETFRFFIGALAVAILIRIFVFEIAVVHQTSMYPTLVPGQWLGVSKVSYLIGKPLRGDIAIVRAEGKNLIKRVIGLPGESIAIRQNQVYINGGILGEEYLVEDMGGYADYEEAIIPENSYFMMGDNRPVSLDSRYEEIGFIGKGDFVGRTLFRIVPPKWFSRLDYPSP
jgi:signal peptidase I